MEILLFDSLTREKREFKPIDDKKVRIYACGPTVYDFAHVGNARMAVVTDLLIRVIKTKFKNVTFVSNITDIDDKIIEAANSSKKPINEITETYHRIYNDDMKSLGVKLPDHQPKATENISEMIDMIQKLLKNDCAYVSDSHVLFNVKKYKFYGCLSRRSKDEQIAGSRVEIAKYKENPEDFILWKPSKKDEPSWESPWGFGRPGWHIECSAMSQKCLNIPFDIHCGGVDLTFPHHENEIAQSCSAFSIDSDPKTFCNYWFHNGFVTFSGEKMSKSLGNIQLVNDLLKKYSGQVIRYSLLSSQYRQPLDWSSKILEQSKKTLLRFYKVLDDLQDVQVSKNDESDEYFNDFLCSLYDDLNTPKALSLFNGWFNLLKDKNISKKKQIKSAILRGMETLGLVNNQKKENASDSMLANDVKMIKNFIKEREMARKNKDFKKADEIRLKLKDLKIELEDTEKGTIWRKV